MAAWGAPDSQRGSVDGSRSSMSSHMPSGMTGLPSILQGTLLPPAALCIALKAGLHGASGLSFTASRPSGILSNGSLPCAAVVQVPQIDNIICKAFDLHSVFLLPENFEQIWSREALMFSQGSFLPYAFARQALLPASGLC